MTDERIEYYLSLVEEDLVKLRDNKFYGCVTHKFEIKGGNVVELESLLGRKIRRKEDLKRRT